MEPYHIKHQHQETVNRSEHSFVHCYSLHTNIQDLQDKTSVLPMGIHLKLHATHLKQITQTQTHFIHYLNARLDPRIN